MQRHLTLKQIQKILQADYNTGIDMVIQHRYYELLIDTLVKNDDVEILQKLLDNTVLGNRATDLIRLLEKHIKRVSIEFVRQIVSKHTGIKMLETRILFNCTDNNRFDLLEILYKVFKLSYDDFDKLLYSYDSEQIDEVLYVIKTNYTTIMEMKHIHMLLQDYGQKLTELPNTLYYLLKDYNLFELITSYLQYDYTQDNRAIRYLIKEFVKRDDYMFDGDTLLYYLKNKHRDIYNLIDSIDVDNKRDTIQRYICLYEILRKYKKDKFKLYMLEYCNLDLLLLLNKNYPDKFNFKGLLTNDKEVEYYTYIGTVKPYEKEKLKKLTGYEVKASTIEEVSGFEFITQIVNKYMDDIYVD